jgi:hypothetical protein
VVHVAQFNPWQAHVIVVDACASRAGSGSIFADLDERAPDLDNVAGRISSDVKVAKSVGRKAKSTVWNKGTPSIDLRTVGVEPRGLCVLPRYPRMERMKAMQGSNWLPSLAQPSVVL